jgi:tetratricopeptide (TPR) repeat protein
VSTTEQREARAALDVARPAVARLDSTRGSEDLAADLIDIWGAVESALRSLVGTTILTGQALIREARQRQLISFDSANGIAEFQAVNERVHNTSYRPTDADVSAARNAFAKLDAALLANSTSEFARPAPAAFPPATAAAATPAPDTVPVRVGPPPRRIPLWAYAALAGVMTVVIVVLLVVRRGGGSSSLQQGVDAYTRGQREVAVNAFNKAVRENPKDALPHVYLARMAREVGNLTLASQELQLALEAEPSSGIALREMGANLLTQGNYELARRFYVRAVEADPTDKTAQGYLGCTLMRLNRATEAVSWLNRAGAGPWSNCTPVAPAAANGVVRP